MSKPIKILKSYYNLLDWSSENNLILEIGSERGEGSTYDLAEIARKKSSRFISVDVTDYALQSVKHPNAELIVYESGSLWCEKELSKLSDYKIKILYLDNFDWTWDEIEYPLWIDQQKKEYSKRGVIMNNFNCVQEHMKQMLLCLPYLSEECLLVFDDTWKHPHEGIYCGKCGPIVHYLVHLGFEFVYDQDCSVIMGKNFRQYG